MTQALTELICDSNREITPADRHAILDQLESNAALIALLRASLNKVEDEVVGLRVDAARYQWIRQSHWYVGLEPEGALEGVSWCNYNSDKDPLDVHVDAAWLQDKEKP